MKNTLKSSFALLLAALSLGPVIAPLQAQAPTGYSDNFDSDTVGSLAPKFVNTSTAAYAVNTQHPVSSPNDFGETTAADGDVAVMTGQAAGIGMCVQYDMVVSAGSANTTANIAPLLASDAAGKNAYLGNFNFGSGNSAFGIYKDTAGAFSQSTLTFTGATAFPTPYVTGNKVWVKEDYNGAGVLKYKIWTYNTPEPSSWLGQAVDSSPITTAGYLGLRTGTNNGVNPQIDDLHFGPSGSVFTDPGSPVPVVTLATSSSIHKSAFEWHVSSASATEEETNTSGAWHEYTVTGTTAVSEQYDVASPVLTTIGLRWSIDNGPYQTGTVAANVSLATGLSTAAHDVKVWVPFLPQTSDRWVTPASCVRLASVTTDTASSITAPTNLYSSALLAYSDSRGEGAVLGDATAAWPYLLGQAFGMETGVRSFASMGWASVNGTATQTGSIVPLFTPGNDSLSSWNKYDAAHSLLVNGLYSPVPAMILNLFGLNDFAFGTSDAAVEASIVGALTAQRTAAGSACSIIVVQDFSGKEQTQIAAGYAQYQAAHPDAHAFLVPLAAIPGLTNSGPSALSADGAHPNAQGQAIVAPTISAGISTAQAPSATSPATYLAPTFTHNTSGQLVITWPADSASTGYKVLRSTDGGNTYIVVATVAAGTLTYTTSATPAGLTYYWHIVSSH